jgi:tRNA nucleotidyltransferase (CCA-adding enzyme)
MENRETPIQPSISNLVEALHRAYPELEALRGASVPVYLVGGAVRDLLRGHPRSDIDVAVVGDPGQLAREVGVVPTAEHDRFGTAKARLDGHEVDIARARIERYPHPGSLPMVEPAPTIEADLARRDFTINAMAIPLRGEPVLIDPHGGRGDLERRLLRVLHPGSFRDDPTRALRAARYAARFGLALEPETEELLRATGLGAVSADRIRAELLRLAGEPSGAPGFELLARWGLLGLRDRGELAHAVSELLDREPWASFAPRAEAVLAAALAPTGPWAALAAPQGAATELAAAGPARPSEAVELARGHGPVELALARALGADWLDRYLAEWRQVSLVIDGADLLAAGVPQGPALGRGLASALRRRLDGEIAGREQELAAALEAARRS